MNCISIAQPVIDDPNNKKTINEATVFCRKSSRTEQSPPPEFDTEKLTDFLLEEKRHKFLSALAQQPRVSTIVNSHDFPAFTRHLLRDAFFNPQSLGYEKHRDVCRFFHKFCLSHGYDSINMEQALIPTREELKEHFDSYTLEDRWLLFDAMSEDYRERFVVNYLSEEEIRDIRMLQYGMQHFSN